MLKNINKIKVITDLYRYLYKVYGMTNIKRIYIFKKIFFAPFI